MKTLKGLKASGGVEKAKALVVENPMECPEEPEHDFIVVAEFTTPSLNLLLMNAKAIACEVGGVTMHASVISRELQIPCVVGATGLLETVDNGDEITVDGDKGEIHVEK